MDCRQHTSLLDLPTDAFAIVTARLGGASVLSLWKCGDARLTRKLRHGGVVRLALHDRYVASRIVHIPAAVSGLQYLRDLSINVAHAGVHHRSMPRLLRLPVALTRLSLVFSTVDEAPLHDMLRRYPALVHLQMENRHGEGALCLFSRAAACPPMPTMLRTLKLSYCSLVHRADGRRFPQTPFFPPHVRTLRLDRRDLQHVIEVSSSACVPSDVFALPPSLERMTASLTPATAALSFCSVEEARQSTCELDAVAALPRTLTAMSMRLKIPTSSNPGATTAFPPGLTALALVVPRDRPEALRALWLSVPRTVTHLSMSRPDYAVLYHRQTRYTDIHLTPAELEWVLPRRLESVVIKEALPLDTTNASLPPTFWPHTLRHLTISRVGEELDAYHLPPQLETLCFVRPELACEMAKLRAFDLARLRVLKICVQSSLDFSFLPSLTDLECTQQRTTTSPHSVAFPPTLRRFKFFTPNPFVWSADDADSRLMAVVLRQLPRALEALDVNLVGATSEDYVPSFVMLSAWLCAMPQAMTDLRLVVPLMCRADLPLICRADQRVQQHTFFELAPLLPPRLRVLEISLAGYVGVVPHVEGVIECATYVKLSALPRDLERLVCRKPFCALSCLDAVMPRLRHLQLGRLSHTPHNSALFPRLETMNNAYATDDCAADALVRLEAADRASMRDAPAM